jgi:asparagine synthase (glutamine-hydrolysing)
MCGICGVAAIGDETPLDAAALHRMTEVISHRGPDDSGAYRGPGVALGMRRLSIIDLPGGHQPIANESGAVVTVFNGEIYNYRELRDELIATGHAFRTAGDTETIVHAYEEDGLDFPRRLRGMFAIAIWDADRRRLVLARDRMGIKPLYVARGPFGLAFASEVKSLIAGGLIQPALDPLAAELFLAFGYVPGPRTLFAGVSKLDPSTVLCWEGGEAREHRYWDLSDPPPEASSGDWDEDRERLLELLRRAVRAEMISDVPLGVMLSGGIDSSLITALMAESSPHVTSFSIGFAEDAESNELSDARRVASFVGTDHHELLTGALDHPELVEDALWHLEEPIADLSQLGFLLLCRLAREHVTVALAGQGADEILGGYRKHQIAALARIGASQPARGALRAASRLAPAGSTPARGLVAVTSRDPVERMLAMSRVVEPSDRDDLLTAEFRAGSGGAEEAVTAAIERRLPGGHRSALEQTLFLDSRLALPDLMLMYFDKMSMAASLEVRVPFLDPDVVAFCLSLPDSRRVRRGQRKVLLREASRGLVDPQTLSRPKRAFFRNAVSSWVGVHRDGVIRETLLDERTRSRGQMEPEELVRLTARTTHDLKSGQRLLCAYLLERWQRLFVDGDRARDMATPAVGPVSTR